MLQRNDMVEYFGEQLQGFVFDISKVKSNYTFTSLSP